MENRTLITLQEITLASRVLVSESPSHDLSFSGLFPLSSHPNILRCQLVIPVVATGFKGSTLRDMRRLFSGSGGGARAKCFFLKPTNQHLHLHPLAPV